MSDVAQTVVAVQTAVQELSKQMGVAVDKLYPILYKQALFARAVNIAFLMFVIVLFIISLIVSVKY